MPRQRASLVSLGLSSTVPFGQTTSDVARIGAVLLDEDLRVGLLVRRSSTWCG